jgi:hypothetical protein
VENLSPGANKRASASSAAAALADYPWSLVPCLRNGAVKLTSSDAEAERIALNESLLRERNEALEPHNASVHWVNPPAADWYCECASLECSTPVQLTLEEYEAIRSDPRRFLIAPDAAHVRTDDERVVAQNERFWVVEKVGVAAEIVETLDPRS